MSADPQYFRKGFGLKEEVQGDLAAYDARIVDLLRDRGYTLTLGDVTIRLAREFGFCYGVERAVEYAYQTRRKFPNQRLFLIGEIIHNPYVNTRLREIGIEILSACDGSFDLSAIEPADVVILPAFGVPITEFERIRALGCVVVDTTCGSVLNVWKRVESYARDRFTAIIHGKHYHEETRATASQVLRYPDGQYLVVRDMAEAAMVCEFIEGRLPASAIMAQFAPRAVSPGFDPEKHLHRIGVANQTTMLASESLAIAEAIGAAIERARGADARRDCFRSFDTICSATQERQDAVLELLREPLDLMVVVGGFNSSNTISLTSLCAARVPTYHIELAGGIDPVARTIHVRRAGTQHREAVIADWLPAGPVRIGVTAGASTPNNKIGETIGRILATRGLHLSLEEDGDAEDAALPAVSRPR